MKTTTNTVNVVPGRTGFNLQHIANKHFTLETTLPYKATLQFVRDFTMAK